MLIGLSISFEQHTDSCTHAVRVRHFRPKNRFVRPAGEHVALITGACDLRLANELGTALKLNHIWN